MYGLILKAVLPFVIELEVNVSRLCVPRDMNIYIFSVLEIAIRFFDRNKSIFKILTKDKP